MSINYCTLGSNTVDSFCSPRRAVVFNRLVLELHPPISAQQSTNSNPQQLRNTAAIARVIAHQRPNFDVDEREPMVYEQPFISVTVELFGATGTQTMDVSAVNIDIVTITGFEFDSSGPEISVNISDFDSSGFDVSVNIRDFEIE